MQVSLEDAEREMGGHSLSLGELENLLNEQGVVNVDEGKRIASDSTTRYLYIKGNTMNIGYILPINCKVALVSYLLILIDKTEIGIKKGNDY